MQGRWACRSLLRNIQPIYHRCSFCKCISISVRITPPPNHRIPAFSIYHIVVNNPTYLKGAHALSSYHFNDVCWSLSHRGFHHSTIFHEKESSKVERTVKALKEEVEKVEKSKQESIQPTVQEITPAAPPKRSLGKRIWDEILHYYHGFRLLFIDIKVSARLLYRILNGDDLSRREHRQLVRTVSDLFRLLPFSVFIIVPFMELLLPVALKLFPNMLPSTFQTSSAKDDKMKKQLKVKLEMAKFLQNTLDEMALTRRGDKHSHTAKEFAEFFQKIRQSGQEATNEEILKFSKLFEDEITLDSLSRPQLVALCRLLELQTIGTNNFLRFQLRMKLRSLNADDQMIKKEGIESLTVSELQAACRARGMRAFGVPEERLRSQLAQWLELSLNEQIPPSLLLLSRALYLPEELTPADQLKATLSALPEEAATEAKYKIGEKEGKVDNKTKIEVIKQEEEAIKREKEEMLLEKQKKEEVAKAAAAEAAGVEAQKEAPIPDMQAFASKSPEVVTPIDEVLKDKAEILKDVAPELEAPELKIIEAQKQEELSKEDFEGIEDAIETIAKEKKQLLIEKEELEELKEEMAEYKEDIEEFKEVIVKSGQKDLKESKAATHLYNRVNKMITKMDRLVDELDKERKTLQEQLDVKAKEGEITQQERDDIISINELLLGIRRLQKIPDDTRLQRIVDVLDKMDVDHDGAVEIDHVLKVIELLGKDNVKVTAQQMEEIIELLLQEEKLEQEEKLKKQEQQKAEEEKAKMETGQADATSNAKEQKSAENPK